MGILLVVQGAASYPVRYHADTPPRTIHRLPSPRNADELGQFLHQGLGLAMARAQHIRILLEIVEPKRRHGRLPLERFWPASLNEATPAWLLPSSPPEGFIGFVRDVAPGQPDIVQVAPASVDL